MKPTKQHGGSRLNAGRKSVFRNWLRDSDLPERVYEQISDRSDTGELETSELLQLASFLFPRLKAVEITEAPSVEKLQNLDYSKLNDEELSQLIELVSKTESDVK